VSTASRPAFSRRLVDRARGGRGKKKSREKEEKKGYARFCVNFRGDKERKHGLSRFVDVHEFGGGGEKKTKGGGEGAAAIRLGLARSSLASVRQGKKKKKAVNTGSKSPKYCQEKRGEKGKGEGRRETSAAFSTTFHPSGGPGKGSKGKGGGSAGPETRRPRHASALRLGQITRKGGARRGKKNLQALLIPGFKSRIYSTKKKKGGGRRRGERVLATLPPYISICTRERGKKK